MVKNLILFATVFVDFWLCNRKQVFLFSFSSQFLTKLLKWRNFSSVLFLFWFGYNNLVQLFQVLNSFFERIWNESVMSLPCRKQINWGRWTPNNIQLAINDDPSLPNINFFRGTFHHMFQTRQMLYLFLYR